MPRRLKAWHRTTHQGNVRSANSARLSLCPRLWPAQLANRLDTLPSRVTGCASVADLTNHDPDHVTQSATPYGVCSNLGRHSYRVVIAYDGTRYSGWQLQSKVPTIQKAVEAALVGILQESRTKLGVSAAGRTDAGVHARDQCVQFFTDKEPDVTTLPVSLNGLLPQDIRALCAFRTAPDFHVTISATGKTYRYLLDTGAVTHDPINLAFRHHHRHTVSIHAMQQAAKEFIGTHDYTQFSNNGNDTARRNPRKNIWRVEVTPIEGGLSVEVEGAGFLHKQVRHMVGALLAVGGGRLTIQDMQKRLQQGAATFPGAGGRGWHVVPAKGLCLMKVHYPPAVDDPHTMLYPDLPHNIHGRLLHSVYERDLDTELPQPLQAPEQ